MPPTKKKKSLPKSHELPPGAGVRTGHSVADLKQSFLDNLFCALGRVPIAATRNDAYTALALTVRDRVFKQGVRTMETYAEQDTRMVWLHALEACAADEPAAFGCFPLGWRRRGRHLHRPIMLS